jgi:ACS family glucarate transporter-like MFS transporter
VGRRVIGDARRRPPPQRMPIRWRIFGFLFVMGFLAYLQQKGLTIAAERMIPELHFSQMQIGWLEQAFVIGYAIFQLPGGILGQRWGARWTFVVIGMLAVVAIGSTALAPQLLAGTGLFAMLFASQLVLGTAQAPVFPVTTGVLETWFEPRRWAFVQGVSTGGLGLGAALAPPFIGALMITIGWQRALLWTALPAVPLYLLWAWYGRNSPREHRSVSEQELALLAHGSGDTVNDHVTLKGVWRMAIDRHVLLLTFSYFSMNYVFYLLSNWCFLYLVQERHFSVLESGWLATAPPLAAGVGAAVGGVIGSWLYERFGSRVGLRLTPLIALPAVGLLLLVAVHAASAYLAVALLALCFGIVELTEGSYWAAAMTIGRSNTMAVGGVMNTGGNLGGIVGIPIVAYLSGHGAWNMAFLVGTGFALASAAAWLFIDASHCVAPEEQAGGAAAGVPRTP